MAKKILNILTIIAILVVIWIIAQSSRIITDNEYWVVPKEVIR